MKRLVLLMVLVSAGQASAREQLLLARVTGYWRTEGCGRIASWNGARLRVGHCAVDPKRIPFGSKVVFPDAECVAVDTGPAVVSRKSARYCGRTAAEKNAIVIDRFFETRQEAVSWSNAHPQFMTVRVVSVDHHPAPQSLPAFTVANTAQVTGNSPSIKSPPPRSTAVDNPVLPPPQQKDAIVAGNSLNRVGR
jgi:3D (Asp-Asp-Asp) domain-containing protein